MLKEYRKPLPTVVACIVAAVVLAGCSTPSFMRRTPEPAASSVDEPVVFEVTPRELLTARLVNRPANDNVPPITVGKLIEFADRYLSCDCSGTRFVKDWRRLPGGYRLETNSAQIRPLDFVCQTEAETTNCYLAEIDRGAQVPELQERFVPGSEFIRFMYENGLQCEREGPCPTIEQGS